MSDPEPPQQHTTSHSYLQVLPSELLDRILQYCWPSAIANLRLTSRRISVVASKRLFSRVHLGCTPSKAEAFANLRNNQDIASQIQTVHLISYELEAKEREPNNSVHLSNQTHDLFQSLTGLPNLTGLGVIFAGEYPTDDIFWHSDRQQAPTPIEYRRNVLWSMLQVYKGLPNKDRIKNLTLFGLQDVVDTALDRDADFKHLIAGLRSLNLYYSHESGRNQDRRTGFGETARLYKHISTVWSGCRSLTSLNFCFNPHHVTVPFLDWRLISFPYLRLLRLGNISFFQRWQLDWIVGLTALRELYLDGCRIIRAWKLSLSVPQTIIENGRQQGDILYGVYTDRWQHYFDRLASLPLLHTFRCSRIIQLQDGRPREDRHVFEAFREMPARMNQLSTIYDTYDQTSDQTWISDDDEVMWSMVDQRHATISQYQEVEDQAAYRRLMMKLSPSSDWGPPPVYVMELECSGCCD